MHPIHKRLAELWQKGKHTNKNSPIHGLSDKEVREFIICLDANLGLAWKLARLENLSLVASIIKDIEWQHELCAEIDQLNNPV